MILLAALIGLGGLLVAGTWALALGLRALLRRIPPL